MMSLEKRMLEYAKYGISMRTTSDANGIEYYAVTIAFNPKWDVVEAQDEKVRCVSQSNNGEYVYFTEVSNGLECIFSSIEETIEYNEDVEKKIQLLREKIGELQELFANETYEKLQYLTFVISEPTKKRGRKPQPKNEPVETKGEENKKDETQTQVEKEETPTEGENKAEASDIDAKIAAAMKNTKKTKK